MHCCVCATTTRIVRPIFISEVDLDTLILAGIRVPSGDIYVCQQCANKMSVICTDSVFVTWVGFACDTCSQTAAFNDGIDDLPTGIVCDDCTSHLDPDALFGDSPRGMWLCETCFDRGHHGHRQKLLQPILDRLANI